MNLEMYANVDAKAAAEKEKLFFWKMKEMLKLPKKKVTLLKRGKEEVGGTQGDFTL